MRRGRYFLGRVIKLGQLDQEKLISAIVSAPIVDKGKFRWTITDVIDKRKEALPFIFGRLSKFAAEGHVKIVDKENKKEREAIAPDLLVASSPFVYLPEHSGIAYMQVWNGIQEFLFARRFKALIEDAYDNFFVDCSIEPIADYRAFTTKLSSIEFFTQIEAKVHPPNPLFGRLWENLFEYIKKRNATEVRVSEETDNGCGLKTEIITHVQGLMENNEYEPTEDVDIADAALLMAADGYGSGKVAGMSRGEEVVVRTADTKKSFLAEKDPDPSELAITAHNVFSKVKDERDMKH